MKTLDDIQALLIEHSDRGTSWQEWMFLYHRLTFIVPSIRDNPFFNCLLFSLVSEKYIIRLWEWRKVVAKLYNFNFEAVRRYNHKLRRIAFISPNFTGHVVSILSIDIITELSSLYGDLEVMLIPTDPNYKESKFMEVVRRREQVRIVDLDNYNLASIAVTLAKLDLDVLIELDGATSISACPLLYCRPALINMSWLGFDAPFISPCNYFLCDRYTHPPEFDEIYVEKLVRLPHSHMCVSGFEVAEKDRDEIRTSLGISQDQVVFIYTAAVRKFNFDTAAAHAQILKRSPKSVLLVKTSLGTLDKPLEVWQQELQSVGVSTDRLIPMQYASTQEEHRFYFKVADIYLDAYPYNGGSQTLEALWCELPVVTLCGQQSFARMGYSLLSTLGITDGIAHSWEEYVEWAVRLATDKELYQKIKHRLWEAKQPATLSPLWNPKQFARDMYNILQDLYTQEVQGRGS
ncbi:MAG: hypothetical protein RMK91_02020 [Pseudanabaenaceae cyanobacterium SKYGB_i_bin29]|nr:hypothetical protein [Pseudanabaenaceae cyanobacterium SKYG29]MDW8420622.1 hypothetical protein [Pseudanabaenaceae cyanobacterium SKYGB_i_bin29]